MRTIGIEYPARGEIAFCELGEPPAPGPRQVLLTTRYSAITNGTERHALMAEHFWGGFPSRHGYQHVAEVTACGSEVACFGVGDVVFYGDYVGHRAWHLVDTTHPPLCVHLPTDVTPEDCALFGVAGVALRGVRRCRVAPGGNVWVAGLGLIGQFAAQAARAVGARVTVTDTNERRLALAAELGAHRALPAADEVDLREGGPYNQIIDCAGFAGLLPQIQRDGLLAHHGAIALMAVRTDTTFNWSMLHAASEGSIEVSCHFDRDDLRVLLHFVRTGVIRTAPLVTHRVSIDEAPAIYATMRDRPADLLGVVFDWRE